MKKYILYIFFLVNLFFICNVYALINYESVKTTQNPNTANTQNNISGARLIEKYLLKLQSELEIFKTKYDLGKDEKTIFYEEKLKKMIFTLRKIQTIEIEKNTAENTLKLIIKDLKILNVDIKNYLKNKKLVVEQETKNTKNNYVKISNKISSSLDKLIEKLENSEKLMSKTEIKDILRKLGKENAKLKNFKNINFNNSSEIKSSFIRILTNIKKNITDMKKSLK